MEGKSISFEHYDRYIFFGDIPNQVKSGYPVIAFGSIPNIDSPNNKMNHAVVVYGYDTTPSSYKYYVHYGWDNASQVILSDYVIGSMYTIHNKQEHKHSWFYVQGSFVHCPCGASEKYV